MSQMARITAIWGVQYEDITGIAQSLENYLTFNSLICESIS
jgi:hypothetical protein